MKVKGRGGKLTLALLCYWLVCLHGTYFCFFVLFFYRHMLKLKGFFVEVCRLAQVKALLQDACLGPLGV